MNRQLGTRCILALWSSPRNPLLLSACLLASAVMAAGEATAQDGPPGGADPIAEIHHLEGTRVGDRVRLEAGGEHVKETHFSWRLDRRPQSSKAKLAEHTARETSFEADVPGIFVVRLTVRLQNATATTSLEVGVTGPDPLVALNTIDLDAQGRPGIVVGTQRYADPGNGAGLTSWCSTATPSSYKTTPRSCSRAAPSPGCSRTSSLDRWEPRDRGVAGERGRDPVEPGHTTEQCAGRNRRCSARKVGPAKPDDVMLVVADTGLLQCRMEHV